MFFRFSVNYTLPKYYEFWTLAAVSLRISFFWDMTIEFGHRHPVHTDTPRR